MVFTSPTFVVFFAAFYSLYLLLQRPRSVRPQNILLLIASNIFYGAWDGRFLALLWFSAAVDFFVAQKIAASTDQGQRRRWLITTLTVQLSILAIFKYLNFGIESAMLLMNALGMNPHLHSLNIILPIGISFYTFQTMAYTIDVYRGRVRPCTDPLTFGLYVSFFPQLVAGPIETPGHLLPQLVRKRVIDRAAVQLGVYFVLIGAFKKVVIADTMAPLVQHVFDNTGTVTGITTLLGVMAFALQIYGDFAGYTYIARGIAKLMGIDLAVNFRRPYLAISPRDFWRRWHISLSNWLRDYLYVSLGGSRKGNGRTYINLLLTMLLGGLWHGASWTFVVWGGYHGALLCVDHFLDRRGVRLRVLPAKFAATNHALRIVGMYVLTLGGWLLFRATSLEQVGDMLRNILVNFRIGPESAVLAVPVLTVTAMLFAYHVAQERLQDEALALRWSPQLRFAALVFVAITIAAIGLSAQPFIYFQF